MLQRVTAYRYPSQTENLAGTESSGEKRAKRLCTEQLLRQELHLRVEQHLIVIGIESKTKQPEIKRAAGDIDDWPSRVLEV